MIAGSLKSSNNEDCSDSYSNHTHRMYRIQGAGFEHHCGTMQVTVRKSVLLHVVSR